MMSQQLPLFHQVNTWMHYIGGYYRSEADFANEAQLKGISRRLPAQVARGMRFGDRVVLLRWGGKGRVWAFAEMTIVGITLLDGLARQVGERLKDQGRASYSEGGACVERECGSYLVVGTWTTDADISEIIEMACQMADGEKVFVMVNGTLTKVYDAPMLLSPAPKFTRSFIRADAQATFEFSGQSDEPPAHQVIAIQDYKKRARGALPA